MRDSLYITRVTAGWWKRRKKERMQAEKRNGIRARDHQCALWQEIANGIFLAEYYIGDETPCSFGTWCAIDVSSSHASWFEIGAL